MESISLTLSIDKFRQIDARTATFSRVKTRLETVGLIDTEKVPIDVGRPRLRLLPGDDRLREAEVERLTDLGASVVETKTETTGPYTGTWTVMRDPEGNGFCVQSPPSSSPRGTAR